MADTPEKDTQQMAPGTAPAKVRPITAYDVIDECRLGYYSGRALDFLMNGSSLTDMQNALHFLQLAVDRHPDSAESWNMAAANVPVIRTAGYTGAVGGSTAGTAGGGGGSPQR